MDDTDTLRKLHRLQRDTEARVAALEAERERLTATIAERAPDPWDDQAAAVERAQAVARDAIDGTRTAAALAARHEREREQRAAAIEAHQARVAAARTRLAAVGRELLDARTTAEVADREVRAELARIGIGMLSDAKARYYQAAQAAVEAFIGWTATSALTIETREPHERGVRSGFAMLLPVCEPGDRPGGLLADVTGFNEIHVAPHDAVAMAARRLDRLRAELLGEGEA